MMLTRKIGHKSDQAKLILRQVRAMVQLWERRTDRQRQAWTAAEETALAYLPEREVDTTRRIAREGGLPQYTTIQIPYSYAVLMTAHTYWTSVFMGRNPVFQYTGRHGESQQKIQALEAMIDYQVLVGKMLPIFYTWLYDVGKYGHGIVGTYWCEKYNAVSAIEMVGGNEVLGLPPRKQQSTRFIKSYQGNQIYNVEPGDFIWDPRVPMKNFQSGEFAGARRTLSWADVKRREALGYYMNVEHITSKAEYDWSRSDKGSEQLDRPSNDFSDPMTEGREDKKQKRPGIVNVVELCVEVLPAEWGLSPSQYPEKWVITCTADYSVVLGVQPHGAYHAEFPFSVLSLEPEGYGLTNRGILETLKPVQQTVDWLLNSHFYNVRAGLNNQWLVDPSKVVMKDLLDPRPGGIIRLKPGAYGSDPRLALMQMNVTDVTQAHIPNIQAMIAFGERTVGVNDQLMGMLNAGGGRKTATEIRTSTSFGVNRLKTSAEYFSVSGFDSLSRQLVQNTQQYMPEELTVKIAGDLLREGGGFLQVTPEAIAGFYDYVPVDGTLPIDRYAQANLWRELMMQVQSMPEIALRYDLGRIFEWVAGLAGLKNITQFRAQIVPDEQLIQQAKLGNVLAAQGKRPGRGAVAPQGGAGPSEPGQVSGMGATG